MTDPHEILSEIRFWQQVMTDTERTVVCSPANKDRIQGWIDQQSLDHLLTVQAIPIPRDTEIYVIDHHAVEAWGRQAANGPLRWRWP